MKKFKFALLAAVIGICAVASGCFAANGNGSGENQSENGQVSESMLMFNEAVAEGYTGSYLDFLETYINTNGGKTEYKVTDDGLNPGADIAALSSVKIQSKFTYNGNAGTITSGGSGVVYSIDEESCDMYIITNYHVVYDRKSDSSENIPHLSDSISVWLFGGETERDKLSATFVGGVKDRDVAVLFVEGDQTVTEAGGASHTNASIIKNSAVRKVTVCDSDDISVGDQVFALGNADGMGIAASQGVVSVEGEYITMNSLDAVSRLVEMLEIRTDAALNHGNSGGGLFNARGELIGMVNARSEESGVRDFGYAIPSNLVEGIARNVIELNLNNPNLNCAKVADLGFETEVLSSHSVFDEETCTADSEETVAVKNVSGSAIDKLQSGDLLLSVTHNGKKKRITREYQLVYLMYNLRDGDSVVYEVFRSGETVECTVDYVSGDFDYEN